MQRECLYPWDFTRDCADVRCMQSSSAQRFRIRPTPSGPTVRDVVVYIVRRIHYHADTVVSVILNLPGINPLLTLTMVGT